MSDSSKNKSIKKEKEMSKRSGMIGFALAGLAAGIATWYLLGTKEGRANLDRALDGMNELSSTLKTKAKEQMECASDKIDKAKNKINELKSNVRDEGEYVANKAKTTGKKVSKDVHNIAKKTSQSASEIVDEAKNKANKYRS